MSIKNYENEEEADRNKGKSVWSGKIIKGTLYDAQTKSRVSSIPNKNQNIVYASTSRFVFGNSSERNLTQPKLTTAVGPGSYNSESKLSKVQSKKGTGFFASRSKVQTLFKHKTHIPGPGSYANNNSINKQLSTSRKKSSSTANIDPKLNAHQLFKIELQCSQSKPGVGLYNLSSQTSDKLRSASFFKSKIDRFKNEQIRSPPIGTYQISPSERGNIVRPKKFKSVQEQESTRSMYKKMDNALKLFNKKQPEPIGPGSYNIHGQQGGKGFKIKQSIYDRFGDLKPIYAMVKSLETEGNKIFQSEPKQTKISASTGSLHPFSSTTKKWEIKLSNQMDPGAYNSNKSPQKQSHLINFQQKWV